MVVDCGSQSINFGSGSGYGSYESFSRLAAYKVLSDRRWSEAGAVDSLYRCCCKKSERLPQTPAATSNPFSGRISSSDSLAGICVRVMWRWLLQQAINERFNVLSMVIKREKKLTKMWHKCDTACGRGQRLASQKATAKCGLKYAGMRMCVCVRLCVYLLISLSTNCYTLHTSGLFSINTLSTLMFVYCSN